MPHSISTGTSPKPKLGIDQWKWIVYGTLALPYLIVYFHRVALNVVASNLQRDFQMSGTMVGTLSAIYFYVYMLMQIPSGILADTWGPKKTVTFGMFSAFIGSLLFAIAPSPLFLFIGRFLVSLGVSVIFISILKIQNTWFRQREFARVTGITVLIGNAGAVLAATPLAILVSLVDWRFAFIVMGLVSLLAVGVTWIFMKNSPQEMGLPSPEGTSAVEVKKESWGEVGSALRLVLSNRWSLILCLAYFGVFGSFLTFQSIWGVPYFMDVFQMDKESAATLLLITTIGHMTGSLTVGYFSDRLGRRKPAYLGCLGIFTTSWGILTFYPVLGLPLSLLYPLCFLIGFFASCFILTWVWAKEVNDPKIPGIAMGTANMAGFLGAALLQTLYGFILDRGWDGQLLNGSPVYTPESYRLAFLISLGTLLISMVAIFYMRETNNRNIFAEIRSLSSTWIGSSQRKWGESVFHRKS
ncbi:Major facilitator superfamily MFS_1 [[Clostridium] ultunense Esp]|uniref:MFS transporter n=1 Tax=Thermicanus aegyptius TaxID=94009 RepID=UPI0002B707EC|nr:MFS transporter [Thermicanus aegyptius]CCQ97287.1 Major facilitator superfamily MFS_1 [[Clostridium] ultunense Esp]